MEIRERLFGVNFKPEFQINRSINIISHFLTDQIYYCYTVYSSRGRKPCRCKRILAQEVSKDKWSELQYVFPYFINKQPMKLKDVKEISSDGIRFITELGSRGMTILLNKIKEIASTVQEFTDSLEDPQMVSNIKSMHSTFERCRTLEIE
jgi:hypothetical protein